jgi:hypothetical protein
MIIVSIEWHRKNGADLGLALGVLHKVGGDASRPFEVQLSDRAPDKIKSQRPNTYNKSHIQPLQLTIYYLIII